MRVFGDRGCLEHRVPAGFPECPRRLEGVLERLSEEHEIEIPPADQRWVEAVETIHDPEYRGRFERAVARRDGILDSSDTPLSPGTATAARRAVETALAGVSTVASGGGPVFGAVRPPGHHAERSFAMGFCYFNNIAVAAEWLLREHGLERVAIFDFDVHHGNGTQHAFSARSDVLFVSVHQHPFYPGTGAADERGVGEGEGFTRNFPLPAGAGDETWLPLIEEEVLPILEGFAPDALLVSAGFDAWRNDPLGGMRVSEAGYHRIGTRLGALADRVCGGRTLALLEGGYDLEALPRLVATFVAGLGGRESGEDGA